jgi:hypothetical protein
MINFLYYQYCEKVFQNAKRDKADFRFNKSNIHSVPTFYEAITICRLSLMRRTKLMYEQMNIMITRAAL